MLSCVRGAISDVCFAQRVSGALDISAVAAPAATAVVVVTAAVSAAEARAEASVASQHGVVRRAHSNAMWINSALTHHACFQQHRRHAYAVVPRHGRVDLVLLQDDEAEVSVCATHACVARQPNALHASTGCEAKEKYRTAAAAAPRHCGHKDL